MDEMIGQVSALTVITPIIREKLPALRAALQYLQSDPCAPIHRISTIHFARWVIFDDDTRLLFASNFDGHFKDYIEEFVTVMPDGLDNIWGNCVGYEGSVPIEKFFAYIARHRVKTTCFFSAYPQLSVGDIIYSERCRDAVRDFLPHLQRFLQQVSTNSPPASPPAACLNPKPTP